MSENRLSVPVRGFLDQYWLLLVLVLFAVAAGSGYIAYDARTTTEQTTQQETVATWTAQSTIDHSTTVQRDTSAFSVGTQLSNRPVYFTHLSPELTATVNVSHSSSSGAPAQATGELILILRGVEEIDGRTVTHWEVREQLDQFSGTVAPGENMQLEGSINVRQVENRTSQIQENITGERDGTTPGEVEVVLVADSTIRGEANGSQFSDTRQDLLRIDPERGYYRVQTNATGPAAYNATNTVTVPVEPSPLERIGAPVLLLLASVGTVWLGIGRWQSWFPVSEQERARYAFEADRSDYDEWVSEATVPEFTEHKTITMSGFKELVDVAIDMDKRVIETADRYIVIADDVVYTYTAPPDPTSQTDLDPDVVVRKLQRAAGEAHELSALVDSDLERDYTANGDQLTTDDVDLDAFIESLNEAQE